MGQKLSTDTSQWTVNDWAFGTAPNAVPMEEVMDEVKQMPMKYFGGNVIQKDTSMQQLQHDLLSFDDSFKRLLFWRKKHRRSKKNQPFQNEEEGYPADGKYYDRMQQEPIVEEDESSPPLPPIYAERNERLTSKYSSK